MHLHATTSERSAAHSHVHPHGTATVLRLSLAATFVYVIVLAIAGVRAHSLALLSEAGHNLSDVLALLLSLLALFFEGRPASSTKTFGYQRAGVLAAFINAASLVVISFFIFYEGARRLLNPEPVQAGVMMAVAAAGVVMNGVIALALHSSSRDVNIRSAFVHMLGDTVSTAAVIMGGWVIMATGRTWVDPALSLAIGLLILWSAVGIVRETLHILLEGTPRGLELARVAEAICRTEGVMGVHDLHIWSLGSESHALSCHILIADLPLSESDRILQQVNDCLREMFHIHHTTIQFEHVDCEVAHGCVQPVTQSPRAH
jgi:cobalt-zinc-cadmium efflux system protein